nr:competence protein CoiA family protein [uncultured Flavobacterium sp.]
MLFAKIHDEKVEATPGQQATCLLCNQPVFSKCGDVNVWHWSHFKDKSCDSWYEPETKWHRNWKFVFGKDRSEIVIQRDCVKHIADILTKNEVVIELQNSPIQKSVIRKRESFYGDLMIWIINGVDFKQNFKIIQSQLYEDEEYFRLHSPMAIKNTEFKNKYNELDFVWSWTRRSWEDVVNDVFIDFGDEKLFHVKEGMGRDRGSGTYVTKFDFIKNHEGDLRLLQTVVTN